MRWSRLSVTRATLIALFCTTSEVFDVPVFWPILVVYFFALFILTMRRQIQCVTTLFLSCLPSFFLFYSFRPCRVLLSFCCIAVTNRCALAPSLPSPLSLRSSHTNPAGFRHMIKYKYVPFDLGRKARYGGPSK
jgi:hypothetical protein